MTERGRTNNIARPSFSQIFLSNFFFIYSLMPVCVRLGLLRQTIFNLFIKYIYFFQNKTIKLLGEMVVVVVAQNKNETLTQTCFA